MSEQHQSLIINSPYTEPSQHWKFTGQEQSPELVDGRREAGYVIANPKAQSHQDEGIFVPLPLANQIRVRVGKWRDDKYPGITSITKALLDHWHDAQQRQYPLFFCQVEALETLIWLTEAPDSAKVGIEIPSDGGKFERWCCKLATGAGKTVVMAMLIAWQTINKVTYPKDTRFSKHFLIVTPGLTVKNRLRVLKPSEENNYYDEFNITSLSMKDRLRQGKVLIHNWHALNWETDEKVRKKKSVDKRGAKSDEAYTREVLGEVANASNLVVINDEAHHAWRIRADETIKGATQEEKEEATKWVGGLDRIHKTRGILKCFDFSATPVFAQ